ncbi:unnamed protein product [Diatraea saccharalis]|uniref:Uncharacterized protein n=1 Tax=Diatraea saccharalis TaxID=40085 RepID=A0A9N9RD55_9NEOP|nr:unnamed protein product [Diatraea saccharalis]
MCYVIITGRSLAWLLLSVVSFMLILTGIMTPKWLLGQPVVLNENNVTSFYVPSVGIYNRCLRMRNEINNCASFSFYGLATQDSVYPKPWKAAMFFLSLCAAVQFSTVLGGVLACCVQSVFKKSVISLAGATQALGGVALVFLASALSKTADKASNSDKVQFQMDEGKQLICLV